MPIRIPRDDVPASTGGLLRPALTLFVVLSLITGLLYPLAVTGVAQTAFPHQANGSLITQGGKAVGSELIGQSFTEPGHFWGRPSATAPMPYNASASGGSNLGPTNPALTEAVKARKAEKPSRATALLTSVIARPPGLKATVLANPTVRAASSGSAAISLLSCSMEQFGSSICRWTRTAISAWVENTISPAAACVAILSRMVWISIKRLSCRN